MKERNELMRQQRAAQYAQLRANAEAAREAAAQRRRERREARERALQLTEQQNVAASVLQRFVRKRQDQLRAQIEMFAPAHKRSELWNRGASHVAKELERRKIAVAKMQATYRSWVARGRPQSRYDQMERVRAACKLQAHTRMRQTRGEYLLRNDMLVSRAILKQNEEYFETLKRQMDEEASLTIQTYYRGAKVRNSDGLKSKHARASMAEEGAGSAGESRHRNAGRLPRPQVSEGAVESESQTARQVFQSLIHEART